MLFRKPKKDNLWIVAGLGNPGKKYENTRHNLGFGAVDLLASKLDVKIKRSRFRSLTGEGISADGVPLLLIKPQTYMNLSGDAVSAAAGFYGVPPERIIILCDDINLPAGTLRIREKGSAGGHNGLKDIIRKIGSDAFYRIRIGAGKLPSQEESLPDWVLSPPSAAEMKTITGRYDDVCDAVELIVNGKLSDAQSRFNH